MSFNIKKIAVITLGCSKNTVDSEFLAGALKSAGINAFHSDTYVKADAVIINTCGFILDAKEESLDVILECLDAKAKGLLSHVFVMGCMVQRYPEELKKELAGVDGFFGVNIINDIAGIISNKIIQAKNERKLSTPKHYAYLKISEGCNRSCAFCAIPKIRGKHISKPEYELVEESAMLADRGVKELIIIAQDTTYYGKDLYGKRTLGNLLNKISEVKGIEWIRLHYAYPAAFPSDVTDIIKSNPKICKYIDIPLQHINDNILKSMKRGHNSKGTRALVSKIRKEIPEAAIRTTFISGFPGETKKAHEELKAFIKESRFERLGIFEYSPEEGTPAYNLRPEISKRVKQERVSELMEIQQQISLQNNQKLIGKKLKVLIDNKEGDFYVGRTEYDSPEIDNEVLVKSHKSLDIGDFSEISITGAEEFDIYGNIS